MCLYAEPRSEEGKWPTPKKRKTGDLRDSQRQVQHEGPSTSVPVGINDVTSFTNLLMVSFNNYISVTFNKVKYCVF